MTSYEKLQNEIVAGFRKLRGRAAVYVYRPINPYNIIFKFIELFTNAHENKKILIVCENNNESKELREIFSHIESTTIIDVLNSAYIKTNFNYNYDLTITLRVTNFDKLKHISDNSKFYLFILDKRCIGDRKTTIIEANYPFIRISIPTENIIEESIYTPVKETLIGVDLTDDIESKYKEYADYITQSMKIFGCFEVLDRCRNGNKVMNYSAIQVCNTVARNNGWSEELDTKEEFNKKVDEVYNPNALYERAQLSYSIMKQRRDLVTDYTGKFEEILRLCKENPDKKIIIISARGNYAYEVSQFLNDNGIKCGNYHDAIPDSYMYDELGNPIVYKSGAKKGEPKVFAHVSQSNMSLNEYNKDKINVLSIKNASDNQLSCNCDILIITSPLCNPIYDIKRRFNNILFTTNPLIVYTIYCNNTIEHTKVDKLENTSIYEVIREDENNFVIE